MEFLIFYDIFGVVINYNQFGEWRPKKEGIGHKLNFLLVLQHLLRFHNMAFAIVLHCTGHPYEDEWNQNDGNSRNEKMPEEKPKIEKEKGYESDEIVEGRLEEGS